MGDINATRFLSYRASDLCLSEAARDLRAERPFSQRKTRRNERAGECRWSLCECGEGDLWSEGPT